MSHKHSVIDTDKHFIIDAVTREVSNSTETKNTLFQYDHNSEQFTFELQKIIDGHDMTDCNSVQIHYINIDAKTKETRSGIYEVNDVKVSADNPEIITFSWLVSRNATQLVGSLNFIVRFACVSEEGQMEYVWSTAIHSNVYIASSISNTEVVVEEYADILASWESRIFNTETNMSVIDETIKEHDSRITSLETDCVTTSILEGAIAATKLTVVSVYNDQEFTDGQKETARNNIGAISQAELDEAVANADINGDYLSYSEAQELTDEQKELARENIGAITSAEVEEQLEDKQDTLVSGKNIKTINGVSLLGNGNITIEGTQVDGMSSEVAELREEIKKSIGETTYEQIIADKNNNTKVGAYANNGNYTPGRTQGLCTEKISVSAGEIYRVSGAYNQFYPQILLYDEAEVCKGHLPVEATSTVVHATNEYIVEDGIAFIGFSTADKSNGDFVVTKEITELNNVQQVVVDTAQEIADGVSFDVTNIHPNGNFEDSTGWSSNNNNVDITISNNIATLVRSGLSNGINLQFGLSNEFFTYKEGDVYFVSAKVITPYLSGENSIKLHINSNDGYEQIAYLTTSIHDEFITICGIKRYASSGKGLSLNISVNLNYNTTDLTVQVKEVALIKVADNSYTDAEIKNIYSTILDQNGGYIDGTVNVAGVKGTLNRLNYEYANESIITENKVVTVGENGDFPTINSALRYLSKFYPAYLDKGIECEVKILDGTIINEQIRVERIDLSHISITTDNANNTVQVDVTGWKGVTHDTRGNRPFFSAEYGARLPCIKCLFSCIVPEGGWVSGVSSDADNTAVGYFCNRGSTGVIAGETTYSGSISQGLANVGFENFYDNIIANNNSEIVLREAIARNAGRYGVMARHISRVSARSADITNCADTGAYADRSSMMDVRFADVSGSNNGLQAFNTSNMTAVETIAKNITNIVADSREGSVLNCAEMTIDNVKDVFKVLNGGTIIATSTSPTNVSGAVHSKTVNTVDVNGIIYN